MWCGGFDGLPGHQVRVLFLEAGAATFPAGLVRFRMGIPDKNPPKDKSCANKAAANKASPGKPFRLPCDDFPPKAFGSYEVEADPSYGSA